MAEHGRTSNSADRTRDLDFPDYRKLLENPNLEQGAETTGIYDEDTYRAVQSDPATTSVITAGRTGEPGLVPVLTPLANLPWFNRSYHERYASAGTPLEYCGHQPLLLQRDPGAYTDALQPGFQRLAEHGGVIVVDYNDRAADRITTELASLARDLSVSLTPVAGLEGDTTPHHHYAGILRPMRRDPAKRSSITSVYKAYEDGKAKGLFPNKDITITPSLSQDDIEKAWKSYEPIFDGLTMNDPVEAGFDEAEFTALMEDPECIKCVAREGDDIINVFALGKVKSYPWMNQYYYQQQFSMEYAEDQIFCASGMFANPEKPRPMTGLLTMGTVVKAIGETGGEPLVTFACDSTSDLYMPTLTDRAIRGVDMKTDVCTELHETPNVSKVSTFRNHRVGHHLFGMLAVSPA